MFQDARLDRLSSPSAPGAPGPRRRRPSDKKSRPATILDTETTGLTDRNALIPYGLFSKLLRRAACTSANASG
jgi:hypothetical protein